jgi:aminoglycoside phosphotransferase (APT) family kinase protein
MAEVSMMHVEEGLIEQLEQRVQAASQSWISGAKLTEIAPLTGGASSLTFTAAFDGVPSAYKKIVLKVAPPGIPATTNRDILRQAVVMRALTGRPGVKVPEVLFSEEGSDLDTPPVLAMNLVPGECYEPMLDPERHPEHFDEYRARALDLARMLAAVHALNVNEIGLEEEPVVPIEAEIDRWTRAYDTCPEVFQHNYTEVAARLHATKPPAARPTVNHGDYRLGNMLCSDGKINAIIDWEIWTVGDPRVDLTWMTFFAADTHHSMIRNRAFAGVPMGQELIDTYVAAGGESYPDMDWFKALTNYKEAAATALIMKRFLKRGDPMPGDPSSEFKKLLDEALELLG